MKDEPIPVEAWRAEAASLFGDNPLAWRFRCPACGNIQTPEDFKALSVDPKRAYVECIGRHSQGRGCMYAIYAVGAIGRLVRNEEGCAVMVLPFALTASAPAATDQWRSPDRRN